MILDKVVYDFLRQLVVNNNKDWFHANKPLYQKAKNAFEEFTQQLIFKTSEIDSSVKGLYAKDCIFRLFRDIRFSNDKTPYKNNFGAYMAPGGRKSIYAGYYFHVEPDNSFVGGGVYCPQSEQLLAVRNEIYNNPESFKKIINDKAFKAIFPEISGEKLKSAPRGFDNSFPDVDLLKYKSYTFITPVSDKMLQDKDLEEYILNAFAKLKTANDFINRAIDASQ